MSYNYFLMIFYFYYFVDPTGFFVKHWSSPRRSEIIVVLGVKSFSLPISKVLLQLETRSSFVSNSEIVKKYGSQTFKGHFFLIDL